ncbi:MAG: efflux RND transporter periplasmic adaptor subunit [Acaryochloridaceae cyanobacterium SU_2_1]|nr:efflux RND transporter periplasmic adaptor subunit [Acaryochloridaceae cyanobacterium SU_2_1]
MPIVRQLTTAVLSWGLFTSPVLAHVGHGNEFKGGSGDSSSVNAVQVDAETAQRLGIKVEPVRRQPLATGIKTTGQLETLPNRQVEVTTPVRGTITRLLVKPGDTVRAGQAVAIVSSPELAELRVSSQTNRAEAIANIQQAQTNVSLAQQTRQRQQQIAQAELQQAHTQLAFAQEKYSRDQQLATTGALPRRQALESKTELADAQTVVARATSRLDFLEADAQLQRAYADLRVARSRLQLSDGTYQARLRQLGATSNADGTLTITAPITGVVADREATLGESGEDAGKPILTILSDRSVLVAANVYEKDIGPVQRGQAVQVKVNGLPNQTFRGRVSLIAPVVTGENRVVPVKAELDNADGALKPGMFANLEIFTGQTANARLVIPQSAVVNTNDQRTVVFIQNGSAFQPINVTLGETAGDRVEVQRGTVCRRLGCDSACPQLYAQSLRSQPAEADHKDPEATLRPRASRFPGGQDWGLAERSQWVCSGLGRPGLVGDSAQRPRWRSWSQSICFQWLQGRRVRMPLLRTSLLLA